MFRNHNLKNVAKETLDCSAGDTVVVWSTDWCVKGAHSAGYFSWHQDSTYSGFGEDAVTCWLAFSAVKEESGPLVFKLGSHKLGQLWHREGASSGKKSYHG